VAGNSQGMWFSGDESPGSESPGGGGKMSGIRLNGSICADGGETGLPCFELDLLVFLTVLYDVVAEKFRDIFGIL